ncbi:hypothetical protein HMPREF3216_01085, partial [Gardnerella vaginalis]
ETRNTQPSYNSKQDKSLAIIAGIIRVQEKHRPNKTQALGES